MAWDSENSPMSGIRNEVGPEVAAAIAQELSAIQGAVERLGKALTELSIRLGPVISGVGPEEARVRRSQSGDSAMTGALNGIDVRLRDQTEFVLGLLRRLEI